MMRTIHLHGSLKKQFGAKHRFDVATAAEALRALNCNFPGDFVGALQNKCFRVVRGDPRTGMPLDIDLINDLKLGAADLHILPVAMGAASGKGGTTKVVLGAALIGGAIFLSGGTLAAPLSMMSQPAIAGVGVTWGNIAAVGLGLTLAGASTLLAKTDSASDTPRDESFSRVGPKQTATQGSAIPLIYGEVITSPVPVSIDADIEDIGAYDVAEMTMPRGAA
jgi:predicted phage tail protein